MEKEKEVDDDLATSLDAESEEALEAERLEERLSIKAESGDELEAQHAEQELAAGLEEPEESDKSVGAAGNWTPRAGTHKVAQGDPPAEGDDGFDLPTIQSSKREPSKEQEESTEAGEPHRTVRAQVLRNEMQMAFLDARLIIHNTFDHVTEGEETSGMSGRVKRDLEFKEYVELVTRVGITLAIARFTSLGIRG